MLEPYALCRVFGYVVAPFASGATICYGPSVCVSVNSTKSPCSPRSMQRPSAFRQLCRLSLRDTRPAFPLQHHPDPGCDLIPDTARRRECDLGALQRISVNVPPGAIFANRTYSLWNRCQQRTGCRRRRTPGSAPRRSRRRYGSSASSGRPDTPRTFRSQTECSREYSTPQDCGARIHCAASGVDRR
jgi:hypothetical protein